MDEWPPGPHEDDAEAFAPDDRPISDDSPIAGRRDRWSEAVGDAWESGLQRDPYAEDAR